MLCSNTECTYLLGHGTPAEIHGELCLYCGSPVPEEEGARSDSSPTETIATFREPHEAHLARGVLESEGLTPIVTGEHTASLGYPEAGGAVRLEVPADQVERAMQVLEADHSADIEDMLDLELHPFQVPTCPTCGSASIEQARGSGLLSILQDLVSALAGRQWSCLTCGARWRGTQTK